MDENKIAAPTQTSNDRPLSTLKDSGWSFVAEVTELSDREFATYRDSMRPVILRGGCSAWKACQRWSPHYFENVAGSVTVPVKTLNNNEITVSSWNLAEYARFVTESQPCEDGDFTSIVTATPYCHDIPLLGLIESLAEDCQPFPVEFLSPSYRRHWWRYSQFFMGPEGAVTPLHFDTLLSHNLFFQIFGAKQFTILPPSQTIHCGRRDWRWFDVDPEQPDYVRFPEYKGTTPAVVTVNAGDILYMPPGTLHHVRSLSTSISFAIDFHTKQSVLDALEHSKDGMPNEVIYYNAITALSVISELSERITFPLYRPYLSYIS
ncbi:MAG: cupin-like domain-containing protein [Mesorhizobium sp.]|uniref:cupin-like domain-containing protein n=1 Tax=Mesorhizobium sp. TaxID=1871066 RepID=UPI000FE62A7A|nr:cupin-like domain-containing protein [Mesorhizobium sp.]RWM47987.1 MAG: cupin-like domain-containing protein [Mesorhizobium sp.]RWM89361.1 MAG: cupin-like domain-containing protein [Mesorhizobium sp.]